MKMLVFVIAILSFIPATSQVSVNNSTTTPLQSGQTFTGRGVDVSTYCTFTVKAYTNKPGLLSIEFSPDNKLWHPLTPIPIEASKWKSREFIVRSRYNRIIFLNNSGENQDTLNIQTIYRNECTSLLETFSENCTVTSYQDTNLDSLVVIVNTHLSNSTLKIIRVDIENTGVSMGNVNFYAVITEHE